MNKYLYLLLLVAFTQATFTVAAQKKVKPVAPAILWQKTLGGSDSDVMTSTAIAPDKSILLCGYSKSNTSGSKSEDSHGGFDYWVVKLDPSGNILWNKTYGGSKNDLATAIICTSDGGYLVGGSSISDISGNKTSNSFGFSYDYWVLKLDVNGNIVWDKTLGGTFKDQLKSLAELPAGGGYVIGGYAYSGNDGTKTIPNLGTESNADYWVVVLNTNGTEKTENSFGGGSHDVLSCVLPAAAGTYYAGGYSYSAKRTGGYKSQIVFGNNDYYIVRYNTTTKKTEYQQDFGGKLSDYLTCMQALPDNTLILGGYSNSYKSNTKTTDFYGVTDYWLLKLKPTGVRQWDRTIAGGAGNGFGADYMVSVQQTKDKGYILGGYSNSNIGNNKTANSKGGYDYWIVKTDSLGKVQWDKTLGGDGADICTGVYEVDSNKYVVTGTSASSQSGDKTTGNIGASNTTDFWILTLGNSAPPVSKLSASAKPITVPTSGNYQLDVMPNPVKDVLTVRYRAPQKGNVDFVIYSAAGNAVLRSTLNATTTESSHSFSVTKLPPGAYFAVMYTSGNKISKAFTKE